ncbi:MAG: hypothetical protein AB1689_12360 [Thermodesulfobacteriota bacterium]
MLQVTEEATAVLKEVRSQSGVPPDAGLRVRAEERADRIVMQVNFQQDPEPTDTTIETPDLRVFVAKELVEPLSDRVLDVRLTDEGPQLMLR